jgi:hypothetical protein
MRLAKIPTGWDAAAQRAWVEGDRPGAIAASVAALNGRPTAAHALQLGYYLFRVGDFAATAGVLERALGDYPGNLDLLLNIIVAHAKARQRERAAHYAEEYIRLGGTNPMGFAALCDAFAVAGDAVRAKHYGEKTLAIKDAQACGQPARQLHPTPGAAGKRKIISFSLWGDHPRYLRGALHNALLAPLLYPGWTCRFTVEPSTDISLLDALREAGAEVRVDHRTDLPNRLCRRFLVSDDPDVGHFLSRDCDSVISERESLAVAEWIASGKRFHVMRDWWAHGDLILAGMWGGTAGALPPMAELLASYRPGVMETAHWDQWFLRDSVWPMIRDDVLVHDRFFDLFGARRFPGEVPAGKRHVGENEYAARPAPQAAFLRPWAERVPSLQLL